MHENRTLLRFRFGESNCSVHVIQKLKKKTECELLSGAQCHRNCSHHQGGKKGGEQIYLACAVAGSGLSRSIAVTAAAAERHERPALTLFGTPSGCRCVMEVETSALARFDSLCQYIKSILKQLLDLKAKPASPVCDLFSAT
jgi:hypothetical protein